MHRMDLAAYRAAGLYDPDVPGAEERRALLEYLTGQGYTIEEMVAADGRGRLFGLHGDELIRHGRDRMLTLDGAAARIGQPAEQVRRLWRALGFPEPPDGEGVLTPDEAETLTVFTGAAAFIGEDVALQLARVFSSAMNQIAAAEGAAIIANVADMMLEVGGELGTAQTYANVASLVTPIGRLLDVLHRIQIDRGARAQEHLGSPDAPRSIRVAVGFVDLVGYTSISQNLSTAEMGALVSGFEDRVADLLVEGDGRLVKFLGDGAMFLAPSAEAGCRIALSLADAFRGGAERPEVRVGLDWGDVLPQGGDYFGPVVNLASRITSLSEPCVPLVSARLRAAAGDVEGVVFVAREAQMAKGIDEPVDVFSLEHA